MALNAKLTNVSECQTEEMWWHLNVKLTNGSECLTVNDDSECQTKDMNLNAKLNNGSKC